MTSKIKTTKSESSSSKSSTFFGNKKSEPFFFNKVEISPSFIQKKAKDDDKLYPIIGVYPILSGDKIIGVRVIYGGTNKDKKDIVFNRISSPNKVQIENDENFKNFAESIEIIKIGNQLYYQWKNKEGKISKIPVANPESKVPDGIINQKEESISIPLISPIQIADDNTLEEDKEESHDNENIGDNHQNDTKKIEVDSKPDDNSKKEKEIIKEEIDFKEKVETPKPRLDIKFKGGTSEYLNKENALDQLQPLIDYLNANPDKTIFLSGHTGSDESTLKEGNSKEVLDQASKVNGKDGTIRELQIARAKKVAQTLISKGIDYKRIKFGAGAQKNSDQNRFVGVRIN